MEYTIAALWIEGPLSYLEQLCLKSFLDAGHKDVVLYHYGELQNVPEGIQLADANEILPQTNFLKYRKADSPALHADLFRFKMLSQLSNTIWADTDAYCVRKFDTPDGHFYGWESAKHVNTGVLGLPQDSDTLRELLAFTEDEFAIPEFYGEEYKAELEAAKAAGNPVHVGDQPWGAWGPHALTHFLKKTGEVSHALPVEALYPVSFKDRRDMLRRNMDFTGRITENTYSIHLYGRRMRARLVEREGGVPKQRSLLGQLLNKHGIDPEAAPIIRKPRPAVAEKAAKASSVKVSGVSGKAEARRDKSRPAAGVAGVKPLPAGARVGRGLPSLTDVADALGSPRGSARQRYTDLYQMLLSPWREQGIRMLQIGPQHGWPVADEPVAEPDLASVRMWLEYFTKAEVYAMGPVDLRGINDDRLTRLNTDMETRADVATVMQNVPAPKVVIDDGTHASHHQQIGFLELFPKLADGGIYAIEGLRWQPKAIEKSGFTTTVDLFQSYQNTGVFRHSDPEIEAAFNDLRLDISGCFVFPMKFQKGKKDQLLVVNKR